jgi:hypothetical protein
VTRPWRLALACALALAAAGRAAAQEGDVDRAFVAAFVAAVNGGTPAARAALVHPTSRPCITGERGEWWLDSVARQAKARVPAEHHWKITPLSPDESPVFGDRFDFPIVPTHVLQLDIRDGPYKFRAMLVRLAKDGDHWAEVVPCAKPETIVAIHAALAERAKRAERVKTLVAGMKPELRQRLLLLIKADRGIEASKTYARESGEDLTTATDVVELLAESPR